MADQISSSTVQLASSADTRPTVRIEAEDGTLSGGFSVERGTRIATSGSGEATYDLSGVAAGNYLVRIGYWDENDGASSVGVTISSASAGTFSDTLALDEATASGNFSSKIYRETTLDSAYMLGANGLLTLTGLAQGREIVRIDYIELIPVGASPPAGNQAPSVSLANALAGIPDDADTGVRIKVADIVVTDDGQGDNTLGLAGADAGLFEIDGTGLFLKAGTALDALTRLDVTVTVDDPAVGGAPDGIALLSLPVTDAGNAAPVLGIEIVDQTVDRGSPVALDVTGAFTDPDGDTLTYTVTGGLPAGVSFADGVFSGAVDAAAAPGAYEVTVTATDAAGSNTGVSDTFVLTVTSSADTRPTVRIEAEDGTLSGGFSVERGTRIATSGSGEATYDLSGVAAGNYLVRIGYWDENDGASSVGVTISSASAGTFSDTLALDEATASGNFSSKIYRETTLDSAYMLGANGLLTLTGLAQGREIVRIDYIELIPVGASPPAGNQAPSVSLANALAGIPDDADTGVRIKVADIVVTDDGQGSNELRLAGADAALFEIDGLELFLRAGAVLDFETRAQLSLVVEADDPAIGAPGSAEASADLTIAVTDVAENQAPTAVTLSNVLASIPENATGRLKVADITVTDDGLGSNELRLAGADAALFEIDGLELFLRAGAVLDFETRAQLSLVVEADDPAIGAPGSAEASADLTIAVTDVAEIWGNITLDGDLNEWDASTHLASGSSIFTLHGTNQNGALVLGLSSDGPTIGSNTTFWFNTDLDPLTGFQVFGGTVGAEYNINIGADGTPALYTGAAGEQFVANLDYAFNANRTVLEVALPSTLVGGATKADLFVDVNDTTFLPGYYSAGGLRIGQNEAPTVSLTPLLSSLLENADTRERIKVADIAVSDDGIGTNELRLSGADAELFEIDGLELYLKANAPLDHETNAALEVNVLVDDPTLGVAEEASASHVITVGDVDETWGSITLDGSTTEWNPASTLATQAVGGANYAVRGTYQDGAFVMAIEADGSSIGAQTTIWLNTDLNTGTGHQVFGFAAGAEYNINFGPDGTPVLYTGAEGQTFVAKLDHVYNADRSAIEIALPSSLAGDSRRAEIYVDVNNSVFLPESYTTGLTFGEKAPLLPVDPTERVAIVYSETSANFYFDKTSYGQLFMAAQHQAMQAGIPFDILSENDLTDIANIAGYDAIIFPGFSHVPSSLLPGITNTLTSASQDYNIGMIAMGNFLTNDETGAAIAGDSYARMKSILGVTLDGFGATTGVTLRAETGNHPVSDLYAPDEVVGSYSNISYLNFRDVSGGGQTLFTQTVNGQDLPAVIATTTGGRNVHFATDAVFGNNNILHEAMKWSAQGSDPEVSLQMTRGSSLFFSRNDMDQSQEIYDVSTLDPGIYDEMIPIIEQWYQDYGFVGSYYINVGADPTEFRGTDWTISRPYYQRIMALESEIGTHSYTHPDDTNLLLPDVITEDIRQRKILTNPDLQPLVRDMSLDQINEQLAAALAATDPAGPNPVQRSSLGQVQQALLEYSLRFQFDYSRQIIERELGLENLGAAVPGAPEKMDASFGMLEYLSYLTGGYSGVGAGYPGAFGFLDPDHTDKVYFAPNVSFDFSLIEFQNLSPEQAEARWAAEFDQITGKGSTPIIHFPWHDYGPTNWPMTKGQNSGYTQEMFTNFLARAYQSGTEFVTGADLARRIESFAATDLQIDEIEGGVRATVGGSNLGTFALELGAGQTIASVGSWYAFSETKVFVDRNGGTFDIATGAQVADVTHIDALPMRADLISVSGDGTELDFVFFGRGEVGIDLKAWGDRSVVASGANSGALAGDELTLDFNAVGNHSGSIDYQTGDSVIGTAANDVIIGSDQGRRIDGGGGDDILFGASGADMFVFGPGVGSDVVRDFDLGADHIALVGTAFSSTTEAYGSFTQGARGTELVFSPTQKLLLEDVVLADLQEGHLLLNDFLA